MLICKDDIALKCSELKERVSGDIRTIKFSIFDNIPQHKLIKMFEDTTFYFYDDILGGRLIETNDTKIVGLRITYNADSTCDIQIKLTRKDVFYED